MFYLKIYRRTPAFGSTEMVIWTEVETNSDLLVKHTVFSSDGDDSFDRFVRRDSLFASNHKIITCGTLEEALEQAVLEAL